MDLNKNQVIAVDFDGTLCKQAWPEIGEENEALIRHLKERKAEGARLILWTNREGDLLEEAVEWCRERGLEFDTVNANLPELIDLYKKRLPQDQRRHLHRRQGSKPDPVPTGGRVHIIKPIREPDRQGRV